MKIALIIISILLSVSLYITFLLSESSVTTYLTLPYLCLMYSSSIYFLANSIEKNC